MSNILRTVIITRVSQYGDYFLCDAVCPVCDASCFVRDGEHFCCISESDLIMYNMEKAERRLVVGSHRKIRIGKKIIHTLMKNQEGKCAYCFTELLQNYHIEHIKPLSAGGTNEYSNLCLSCPRCNFIAGPKYFKDYDAKRDYILNRRNQTH
jgi:5-methylcytosine-specific restriction endonuclease McrA